MDTGNFRKPLLLKVFNGHAQPGARRTRVVNGMVPLGGTFGIHPDSHVHALFFTDLMILFQLCKRIKHYMAANVSDSPKFRILKGRSKDMGFLSHFLMAEPRLKKSAGRGSVQIFLIKAGKGLLSQKNPASGLLPESLQNLQIFS